MFGEFLAVAIAILVSFLHGDAPLYQRMALSPNPSLSHAQTPTPTQTEPQTWTQTQTQTRAGAVAEGGREREREKDTDIHTEAQSEAAAEMEKETDKMGGCREVEAGKMRLSRERLEALRQVSNFDDDAIRAHVSFGPQVLCV
jgi:hypothetical protein